MLNPAASSAVFKQSGVFLVGGGLGERQPPLTPTTNVPTNTRPGPLLRCSIPPVRSIPGSVNRQQSQVRIWLTAWPPLSENLRHAFLPRRCNCWTPGKAEEPDKDKPRTISVTVKRNHDSLKQSRDWLKQSRFPTKQITIGTRSPPFSPSIWCTGNKITQRKKRQKVKEAYQVPGIDDFHFPSQRRRVHPHRRSGDALERFGIPTTPRSYAEADKVSEKRQSKRSQAIIRQATRANLKNNTYQLGKCHAMLHHSKSLLQPLLGQPLQGRQGVLN